MENQDKSKLHNQEDVNPTSQLDKIVEKKSDDLPETTGTGSNRPVATDDSVIIKDGDDNSK
jgi:hypothetical protein